MKSLLIVTTTSCPKCPAFKEEIHKIEGVNMQFIDETSKHFSAVCKEYDLVNAPVVVYLDEKNTVLGKYDDVEELKKNL